MPQQQPDRTSPPPAAGQGRPDASMSLLTTIMEHSLDDGYAEAAARRGRTGTSRLPSALSGRLWLAAGLVLAAVVVTVGAAQTRASAPTEAKERQKLVDRVQTESRTTDALQRTVDGLRRTVSDAQHAALRDHGGQGSVPLLELLSAATPVHGPGVKLVVDDAKEASSGGSGPRQSDGFSDTGRVRDRDMQRVVNGLWESGAEAVSVNGQRLTVLSAVRAAGEAILVNNKPLAPPYTVLAIGDGERLRTRFQDSAEGQYLQVLKDDYGIRASMAVEKDLRLPAAPSLVVRYARPAPGTPTPGSAVNGKGSK